MTRIPRAALWLLAATTLPGCREPLPDIEYETRRARIGTTFSFDLCAGDLDRIDRQIEIIESRLAISRPKPVELYIYGPGDLPCDNSPFGCYLRRQDVVAARPDTLSHELVHAIAKDVSFPNKFWSEGVAEAVKGEGTINKYKPALKTYDATTSGALDYAAAGHFARWLVETRGIAGLRDLVRGASPDSAYGESLVDLAADYDETAPYAFPDWEPCDFPALPSTGEQTWGEDFDFDCETPGVTSLTGLNAPSAVRSLALDAGTYAVTMEGGEGLWIRGCQMETLLERRESFSEDGETVFYWDGDVFNEAQFSLLGVPTLFPSDERREIELEAGVYEIAVASAGLGQAYSGNVTIERTR